MSSMNVFSPRSRQFFFLVLCCLLHLGCAQAEPLSSTAVAMRPGWITWIERPWSTRYFIQVDTTDGWDYSKKMAIRDNAKQGQKFFNWQEFFFPSVQLTVKPDPASGEQSLSVVVIDFDKDGRVVSPHTHAGSLWGRLNQLQRLGLSEGDALNDRYFGLAYWFTGIGDSSTHWAPAFCTLDQRPDAAMVKSDGYLYGKSFTPNGYAPLFGCREWAYQLYDNDRPYIDVTSYEPTGKGKPPIGYIREFIGWARFGDSKPIIGQHEGDWYCLHDCPGGDKPGLILDIKTWAKRFHWSVPVPPTRVPTFPDPPAKAGTYPYEQKPLEP
jgi:hypothetical protein